MTVVIVGAGASGLMAAGTIKAEEIIVLDRNEKAGKKLYITGKGRCNVTNDCTPSEFLNQVVSNPKFLMSALYSFPPFSTIELLNQNGTATKVERGGRVFPLSDKASDVTKSLTLYAQNNGATFKYGVDVKSIVLNEEGKFILKTSKGDIMSHIVVLACGGKSYSATGSNGDGYILAKMLGHQIVQPVPALVPILLQEDVSALSGLSLKNVRVTVEKDGNIIRSEFGEMLFTSNGVSGPIVLSLSSYINRLSVGGMLLKIDLKPALDEMTLDKRLLSDFEKFKGKQIKNSLNELMPKSLIPYVLRQAQIQEDTFVNCLTKVQREGLAQKIKAFTFTIKSLYDIECGIVTAGGVNVKELSPKTMESKLVKNLYIVGEMIDVDALTGGYNIQIALSTGFAAGNAISNKII